jgi:hypothetical protein
MTRPKQEKAEEIIKTEPKKKVTLKEASVQIYKIHMIQWLKLPKDHPNYQEDAESEIVGDIVFTVNGRLEECMRLARTYYPNSIITEVEIYNPAQNSAPVETK